ncbi:MAG: GLUG motif-containing protein [Candidatus Coproplasma sp.]
MNKFKKIAIGALLAVGASCLTVGVAACNSEPDYFKLTFEGKGLDYVFQGELAPESGEQFESGYLVKSGVEVRFTLAVSENTEGTPVILLNGVEITPGADGVYSFIIDQESVVSVSGLTEKKKITFSQGDYYKFIGEDGNEITETMAVKGSSVKFKVWVSPYMVPEYTITNNTEELTKDDNGYYTIDVSEDSTVNISTLNQADSFIERGEGTGTEDDPYIVKEPIDMFMVAALVNSDFYTSFSTAYYKLEADIDMQGEKLFVIGDMSNSNAIFCGNFDGNGHKISNFYLTDEVIDQESFDNEYLPYVGVFGAVVATTGGPAVIKNLTIEDFEVTVHPISATSTEQQYITGSLVAYGIGAQIDDCNALNGKITAQNDTNKTCNVGGLVGVLQSAYSATGNTVITYDAYVNGCVADVDISGVGVLYCVGGAVGMLATADTQAIAYVSNTVTSGSVSGTIFVGGVVGNMSRFSSVANCYSTSAVTARNTNNTAGMAELVKSANAGGIVGYAENDTVISDCYSANTAITATSANNNSYASKDNVCARKEAAKEQASDAAEVVLFNNLAKADGDELSSLGWSDKEWDFTGEIPVFKGNAERTIQITLNYAGADRSGSGFDISAPAPIYTFYEGYLGEYVTTASGRSWGYYFDAELTKKVPTGFIPLGDVTLYYGLADYSEVAGQYYLGATEYGVNANFTLNSDGSYAFRDGGMSFSGTYSYDGQKITLFNSCLGAMAFTADETNGSYATVVMVKDGDGYKIEGKIYVRQFSSSTSYTTSLEELSFTATKKSDTFTYGEYTNSNGATLVLKENGTGTYTYNKTSMSFTFTITGDGITNSMNLPITVTDGKVTAFVGYSASLKDNFAGSWKTNTGSSIEYVFDGFSTVKCGEETGTYEEISAGRAQITLGGNVMEAVLTGDALYIDGVAHYISDGFTGMWTGTTSTSKERFELTLGGIGKNGYGEAEITFYSGITSTVTGEYSVTDDGVMVLYVGDTLYGELVYNKVSGLAEGSFYSYKSYSELNTVTYVTAQFALYDLFKGVWECNVDGVNRINFTGKTAGGKEATAIVTYSNGSTGEATYTLDSATTGQIKIGGNTYDVSLDEKAVKITLTLDEIAAGILVLEDDWSGVTLYDGDTAYTFDGRGNLGGKVTVTGGSELTYVIGEDGMPVIDGTALVVSGSGFEWGGKTLVFNTGFAKTWLMSVSNKEITISEVTSDFTAKLRVSGEEYLFIYNPKRNTLTNSTTDAKGVTTVTTIALQGSKELSISVSGATNMSAVLITEDSLDDWKGVYTAEDKSVWEFDGHGLAEYSSGKATYTDANGKKTTYNYRQNSLGLIQILTGTSNGMVFTEVETGGYKKDGDTKSYSPVAADTMYLTQVRLNGDYVTLDGVGNIWSAEGKTAYTYTYLTTYSNVPYLIVEDGEDKSLATITKEGSINVLTLGDYVEWTLKDTEKRYIFVGGETGSLWLVDGDSYVREYYYESDSQYARIFYLTDMDEKNYKMTLKTADNTFVLEELEYEN